MKIACVLTAVAAMSAAAWAQSAADVVKSTGAAGGLAVIVGAPDAALAADLATQGFVVRGLTTDTKALAAARQAIAEKSMLGLVTLDHHRQAALPFAENSINLLIDNAGSVKSDEVLRVLVPGGAAYVNGKVTKKPIDAGFDDWTHFSYNPQANAVSKDKFVRPSNAVKFVAGVTGLDIRVARGTLYAPLAVSSKDRAPGIMTARDAYNGVPRWRAGTGVVNDDRPTQWAADARGVFHFADRGPSAMILSDPQTGQTVRTFDEGLKRPLPEEIGMKATKKPGVPVVLICGDTVLQSYGNKVAALNIATGKQQWLYEAKNDIAFMVANADGTQVFIKEVKDADRGRGRWGRHNTVAITALINGKERWRTPLETEINDLLLHDNDLYAFNPTANLGDDGIAQLYKFDAGSGKQTWASEPIKQNYNVSLFNFVLRENDNRIYSWGPFNHFYSFDPATGAGKNHTINGYNQRCTRMSATETFITFGLTSWLDKDLNWSQSSIGRSSCAMPGFLAHGLTYYTYNVTCGCINNVRGVVALTHHDVAPISNDQRLEKFDAPTAPLALGEAPKTIAASEWQPDPIAFFMLDNITTPVAYGQKQLVADVHRHTLTATQDDKAVWSFTAGARIYSAPLIHNDRAYVACADGYLYCLDANNGKLQWRFLAAPQQRLIYAYGQFESVWPVYNVALHDGAVCVAAGRHAELDGGLFFYGVDPASGAIKWSSRMFSAPAAYAAGQRPPRGDRAIVREVSSVQPLNGGLVVEDGKLILRNVLLNAGGSRASKTGYFLDTKDLKNRPITLDPAAINGRTIDPRELVSLEKKK